MPTGDQFSCSMKEVGTICAQLRIGDESIQGAVDVI